MTGTATTGAATAGSAPHAGNNETALAETGAPINPILITTGLATALGGALLLGAAARRRHTTT
jgi:hypothetical protein